MAVRNLLRLEQVYLGASHLRREFPDVRRVSDWVLKAFRDLPMQNRVRDIKHFVKNFVDIQYSEVKSENVPQIWPNDKGADTFKAWNQDVQRMKAENAKNNTIEKAIIEIVE
jgi:hypothetical protein